MNKTRMILAVLSLASMPSLAFCTDDIRTKSLTKMEQLKIQYALPSLSVAIGSQDKIVFAEAIGFSDLASGKNANRETQYSVGSLAKPMTGIALARLVDSGKLRLDARVSQYVKEPGYTNSFTVNELASHMAGIPHDTPERRNSEFVDIKDHQSPFEAFTVFSSHPLLFEPGSDFEYSSNGYILLSAVIERAAEMNYVDFIRESLWEELDMSSTELDVSDAGDPHEATYYQAHEEGGSYRPSTTKRDRSFLFGGGGFISTPSDLIKMGQATYDSGYLSDKMRSTLRTPVKLSNGEVNDQKYSLGWRTGEIHLNGNEELTWTALHHGGVTDDASTAYLLVIPECKASIAFATNYVPAAFWEIRGELARLLIDSIDPTQCSKADPSIGSTRAATVD